MLAPVARLRDGVLRIGSRPAERPEHRVRREALVLSSIAVTVLSLFWTGTYVILDRPLSAAVPFAYQVISVVGLIYLARTGDSERFQLSQVASMLVLPFVLQWSLGGFVDSSAMMVWAFTAVLAALVLYGARRAAVVFAAYLGLTVVSGAIDPFLSTNTVPVSTGVRLLFFVLNIGAVSLVAYLVLQYVVWAREQAQRETENLLNNILPVPIADRLKEGEQRIADDYPAVTVLFGDVAGFTQLARSAGADEVISILDQLFTAFDALAEKYGLEKIKTIGDAYMAVAGAPQSRPDHVRAAADMALAMLDAAQRVSALVGHDLPVRIGIHSGAAMAGVIGRRKFAYDLWGDAVNVASRMESHGVPGRIQASPEVEAALRDEYRFEDRGTIEIKGLGEMHTYFLLGPA